MIKQGLCLFLILGLIVSCNNPKSEEKTTENTNSEIIENPTNKGGGACWDFNEILKIRTICDENKLCNILL